MGSFLSGALGTNSAVQTSSTNPYAANAGWQNSAQGLNGQLSQEAAGGGPNPAQMQFLQNNQQIAGQQAQNYAQNRALNPGLASRQAGQTAANLQQTGASTAAIQQAQQQLAAQQLQGNMIAQQEGAMNQASGINAGVAAGNQQASQGILGGIMGGAGAALGLAQGGMVPKYDDGGQIPGGPGSPYMDPNAAKGVAQGAQQSGDLSSGWENIKKYFAPNSEASASDNKAMGGKVGMASGGPVSSLGSYLSDVGIQGIPGQGSGGTDAMTGGMTQLGGGLKGGNPFNTTGGGTAWAGPDSGAASALPEGAAMVAAKGGKVPALVSPGEKYLKPEDAKKVAAKEKSPSQVGEKIPGKAMVKGDSEKNDVVSKKLDEGGVVIPRSVMNSGDEKQVQSFVAKAIRDHGEAAEGDFKTALKKAIAGRKNK